MTVSPSRAAHDGYEALAPLYDEFVAHPGYRHWVLSIEAVARGLGVRGVRLLDVGCGTGRSFAPLLERGYLVTGCEPVAPMLAQARRRSPRRVRTTCALAGDAPGGRFDLVIALNDVINCIPHEAELLRTFRAIAARLAPEGVFAFDLTPAHVYASGFLTPRERTTARARFDWRPLEHVEDRYSAVLETHPPGRPTATAVHRQRAIGERELHRALAAAGLRVAAVRGCDNEGRVGPASDAAFKHLYFAQISSTRHPREEVPDAEAPQAGEEDGRHAVRVQDRVTPRGAATRGRARRPDAGGAR